MSYLKLEGKQVRKSIPEVAAATDRKQKTDLKPDRRRSCQQEARISEELPSIPLNWSSVHNIFNIWFLWWNLEKSNWQLVLFNLVSVNQYMVCLVPGIALTSHSLSQKLVTQLCWLSHLRTRNKGQGSNVSWNSWSG